MKSVRRCLVSLLAGLLLLQGLVAWAAPCVAASASPVSAVTSLQPACHAAIAAPAAKAGHHGAFGVAGCGHCAACGGAITMPMDLAWALPPPERAPVCFPTPRVAVPAFVAEAPERPPRRA